MCLVLAVVQCMPTLFFFHAPHLLYIKHTPCDRYALLTQCINFIISSWCLSVHTRCCAVPMHVYDVEALCDDPFLCTAPAPCFFLSTTHMYTSVCVFSLPMSNGYTCFYPPLTVCIARMIQYTLGMDCWVFDRGNVVHPSRRPTYKVIPFMSSSCLAANVNCVHTTCAGAHVPNMCNLV